MERVNGGLVLKNKKQRIQNNKNVKWCSENYPVNIMKAYLWNHGLPFSNGLIKDLKNRYCSHNLTYASILNLVLHELQVFPAPYRDYKDDFTSLEVSLVVSK